MLSESIVSEFVFRRRSDLLWLRELCSSGALLICLACMIGVATAQTPYEPTPGDSPYVVEGENDTIVYAIGHSLKINGSAKNGAFALGGDVMVIGGTYRHVDEVALRGPGVQTIMFAGYEQELRNIVRNPKDLLAPNWSARSIGLRILVILFWFIVSLALTAAMPGTISRGIARLQLTSLRVAFIGILGVVAVGPGAILSLRYLPTPISALVGLMALLLILIAGLFGRVMIYAATGRWLQRHLLKQNKNSEAVALLLGTTVWIMLSSLPYVWPFVVAVVWVLSLGLALTARYRVGWKRSQHASH